MTAENQSKPKISTEFVDADGKIGTRSKMDDFQTLRSRIYDRLTNNIGADECDRLLVPCINAYNRGDYEVALGCLLEAVKKYTVILGELQPHVRICQRVIEKIMTPADIQYRESMHKWNNRSLLKRLAKKPLFKVRCKYCGHYTPYIHPEYGFAYLGSNNCSVCNRGYPAPEFTWDSVDGQAYIYYRHSVTEQEFYKEFEEQYNVSPDHTFFLSKKE